MLLSSPISHRRFLEEKNKTPWREFYTSRVKISYQWGDYESHVVFKMDVFLSSFHLHRYESEREGSVESEEGE